VSGGGVGGCLLAVAAVVVAVIVAAVGHVKEDTRELNLEKGIVQAGHLHKKETVKGNMVTGRDVSVSNATHVGAMDPSKKKKRKKKKKKGSRWSGRDRDGAGDGRPGDTSCPITSCSRTSARARSDCRYAFLRRRVRRACSRFRSRLPYNRSAKSMSQ
jgi:hypothetical protein